MTKEAVNYESRRGGPTRCETMRRRETMSGGEGNILQRGADEDFLKKSNLCNYNRGSVQAGDTAKKSWK